jgi:CAAX prenyl protease-like protein
MWFEVTRHPTAEWLARQITEAFPWATAPTYLVRDNDCAYGHAFRSRVRAMGIRDRPISPRSPWQNPYVEPALFGAAHLIKPNADLVAVLGITFAGGVPMAALYLLTSRLWASIGYHIAWNFTEAYVGAGRRSFSNSSSLIQP